MGYPPSNAAIQGQRRSGGASSRRSPRDLGHETAEIWNRQGIVAAVLAPSGRSAVQATRLTGRRLPDIHDTAPDHDVEAQFLRARDQLRPFRPWIDPQFSRRIAGDSLEDL